MMRQIEMELYGVFQTQNGSEVRLPQNVRNINRVAVDIDIHG